VICFKTGGLKDTVKEYSKGTRTGNGFTFEGHTPGDFVYAVKRAVEIYDNHDHYEALRMNARASVLDCRNVCIAWAKDFAVLRERVWEAPDEILAAKKMIVQQSQSP